MLLSTRDRVRVPLAETSCLMLVGRAFPSADEKRRMYQSFLDNIVATRTLFPNDRGYGKSGSWTLDHGRLAGHRCVVAHGSDVRWPVDVEPGAVTDLGDPVDGRATVLAPVLDSNGADVNVRYDVPVHGHVLSDHESANVSKKGFYGDFFLL